MRKNYSKYFAILFVFSLSFILISCSDDDDDHKIKIEEVTETTLYLDGVRQNLVDNHIIFFTDKTKQLGVSIEGSKCSFRMSFMNVEPKNLKPGFNLAKVKDFEYFLSLPANQHGVLSSESDNLSKHKGTVGIMAVNKDTMSIKLSNLYVESRQEPGKFIKIDGTIIRKFDKY